MSYYWFSREELLKKAKEKYGNKGGKEKAAQYYKDNKEAIKEKAKNKYKNLREEEKELKRQYSRIRYNNLTVCSYHVTYVFQSESTLWLSVHLRTKWLWVRVHLQS